MLRIHSTTLKHHTVINPNTVLFHRVSVVTAVRETPGPIPNPEAKPTSADGTAPDRVWESRTPPNLLSEGSARLANRLV